MLARAVYLALLVAPFAHADIYTWTDSAGSMNVSNMPPPEDVKVTKVIRTAPRDTAREAAARETARQTDLRELNERVQQLEVELDQARRPPPASVAYIPPPPQYAAPAPYVVNIVNVTPPAPPTYPITDAGCDYGFGSCGPGFGGLPYYYYPGNVVIRDRDRRHRHPGGPGGPPRGGPPWGRPYAVSNVR